MEKNKWMGVCCEPNVVFVVCNQFPVGFSHSLFSFSDFLANLCSLLLSRSMMQEMELT
jgi:hypothetical protein